METHLPLSLPPEPRTAAATEPPAPQEPTTPSVWPSHTLLKGQKSVQIAHNGSIYQLQATKLGKLILTK